MIDKLAIIAAIVFILLSAVKEKDHNTDSMSNNQKTWYEKCVKAYVNGSYHYPEDSARSICKRHVDRLNIF